MAMYALGIDACLGHCSVALLRDDRSLSYRSEAMARGHVERLAPMVSEVLEEAAIRPSSLDIVGVTCGPGGFTGARLGASFARGLSLATGCRAVGVTTLEALAFPRGPEARIVALDGRRGDIFVQSFDVQDRGEGPTAIPAPEFPDFVERHGASLVIGPTDLPPIDPEDVARIAMPRQGGEMPRPMYLRAPDAKVAARPVLG